MATLISRITIAIEGNEHTSGEGWQYKVRVPSTDVIDRIEEIISPRDDIQKQIFSNPAVMNAIMDSQGDVDKLKGDPEFMKAMGSTMAANPEIIFGSNESDKDRQAAELILEYCDDPEGFEPPVSWNEMESANPVLMKAALAAGARRIHEWTRGEAAKVRLKN